MPATLSDLIVARLTQDAQTYRRNNELPKQGYFGAGSSALDNSRVGRLPVAHKPVAKPHSFQSVPEPEAKPQATPDYLVAAFAKLDEMTSRCDALLERNGRWTRYVTGDDNV